ncbi:MAG: Tm-1-like ATP-binding domain-containing protein [Pseudomonadota bacterium]
MTRNVLLVSTLDTKAVETLYLRDRIEAGGARVSLMDLSMGAPSGVPCEAPPEMVAAAAGWTIEDVRRSRDRSKITAAMISGAVRIARERFERRELDCVAGLGGSTGSLMASDVMRALPFGLPKVMVSSTAALPGLATRYIDTGDLLLFHTVVEISGLSPLLKNVLDRAAAAIVALAGVPAVTAESVRGRNLVAMSMFGPCERCAHEVRLKLEAAGWRVIGFSAAGVCDRAMEDMIAQGFFSGVIDLASGGVGEHLLEGMRSAGPFRLEAAGRAGIPQVVAPSGVNLMSPRKSRYKPDYHARPKFDLDKLRTFIRLNQAELADVARAFAAKLNQAQGPARVLIPTRGWASIDREGSPIHAPEEDRIFTSVLREALDPKIKVIEIEANLEDDLFIEAVVRNFSEIAGPAEGAGAADEPLAGRAGR